MSGAFVDYDTYIDTYHGQVDSARFARVEPMAERVLDVWTAGRVRARGVGEWEAEVAEATAYLVDHMDAIEDAEAGDRVQSFSNGQDSYTFADVDGNPELQRAWRHVMALLPPELGSQCVGWGRRPWRAHVAPARWW